jgi:hypothetical protein
MDFEKGKRKMVVWMERYIRPLTTALIRLEAQHLHDKCKLEGTAAITPQFIKDFQVIDRSLDAPVLFEALLAVCEREPGANIRNPRIVRISDVL